MGRFAPVPPTRPSIPAGSMDMPSGSSEIITALFHCYPDVTPKIEVTMSKATLTARNAFTLPAPEKGRLEYFDRKVSGLALRVTVKGHRSWTVLYRHKGTLRRFTLGELLEPQGLAWARQKAERDVFGPLRNGIDPAADKKRQRKADTFKQLAELYIE